MYSDPGLKPQRHPARLVNALLDRYARLLGDLPGSRHDVREFLGRHLSEPKPHVRFERPVRRSGPRAFARSLTRRGMRPATATIMLYRGNRFFVNGESVTVREDRALLSRLADRRALEPGILPAEDTARLLYTWYLSGYFELGGTDG
jgi:50S ribosomal protein L16 3-hydroxylase